MRIYRIVWLVACAALSVGGVGVAWHAAPAELVAVPAGTTVAAMIGALLIGRRRKGRTRGSTARRLVMAALAGASVGGAFAGIAVLSIAAASALTMVLVGTSPLVLSAVGRWLRARWNSPRRHLDVMAGVFAGAGWGFEPVQPVDDPCLLTDEQLCAAWRASTETLRECPSEQQRRVVARRQRYLDEFARRNPKGLRAWLASSDTTSVDPREFLLAAWTDAPSFDWDELTRGQGA